VAWVLLLIYLAFWGCDYLPETSFIFRWSKKKSYSTPRHLPIHTNLFVQWWLSLFPKFIKKTLRGLKQKMILFKLTKDRSIVVFSLQWNPNFGLLLSKMENGWNQIGIKCINQKYLSTERYPNRFTDLYLWRKYKVTFPP
jgi:hypothetical protein